MNILTTMQDENVQISLHNNSNQTLNIDSTTDHFTSSQNDLSQQNNSQNLIEKVPQVVNKETTKSNSMIESSNKNRNKEQNRLQTIAKEKIYFNLNPNSTIKICDGLSITSDGIIRFDSCISQIIFEQQQSPQVYIKEDKSLGIIDVELQVESFLDKQQTENLLQKISSFPHQIYHDIVQNIYKYMNIMQQYKETADQMVVSEELIKYKEDQFHLQTQYCYEYLKKLRQDNPCAMYTYGFGRFNVRNKKMEFSKVGFSQSYLELLGIDNASFIQMLLRNKEVDLLQNKFDALNLSQIGLNSLVNNINNQKYSCNINTFDGFPLKLYQTQKIIGIPSLTFKPQNVFNEIMLCLTEFDVDFQELQNLINYRQKISENKSNLTTEELIQKELSYKFEDVEYSVLSQSFIEKYYQQNVQKLLEVEQQYYNRKEMESKQCSYVLINKQ